MQFLGQVRRVAVERVVAVAADQGVVAPLAVEHVVARAAVEQVVAALLHRAAVGGGRSDHARGDEQGAGHRALVRLLVAPEIARHQVVAGAAEQFVVAFPAGEDVVVGAAVKRVVAGLADQDVVAGAADQHVVAAAVLVVGEIRIARERIDIVRIRESGVDHRKQADLETAEAGRRIAEVGMHHAPEVAHGPDLEVVVAEQHVHARPAHEQVFADAAEQHVVAGAAVDAVVAAAAGKPVAGDSGRRRARVV